MIRALILVRWQEGDGQLDTEWEAIKSRLPDDTIRVVMCKEKIPSIQSVSFLWFHLGSDDLFDAMEGDGDLGHAKEVRCFGAVAWITVTKDLEMHFPKERHSRCHMHLAVWLSRHLSCKDPQTVSILELLLCVCNGWERL